MALNGAVTAQVVVAGVVEVRETRAVTVVPTAVVLVPVVGPVAQVATVGREL
jgi:hypothetical protein